MIWGAVGNDVRILVNVTEAPLLHCAIFFPMGPYVVKHRKLMPLLRAAHDAKGIDLYLAPTADGRNPWLPTMTQSASEDAGCDER